jgi:cell wall-associated NlpC family hydrolase
MSPGVTNQQKVVNEALYWKGKIPYWSPSSYNWQTGILDRNNPPARMDCSDFASAVYVTALGIRFQEWTGSQMTVGSGIAVESPKGGNYSNLVPGDLIIFTWTGGNYSTGDHVAIYIGNGQIVHESSTNSTGGNVKVNSINENWGTGYGYIRNNIISIRRVI